MKQVIQRLFIATMATTKTSMARLRGAGSGSRELKAGGCDIAGTLVGLPLELDDLIMVQAGQAGALDVLQVHEHVLAAIMRGDDAIALARVKKLHRSLGQAHDPPEAAQQCRT